MKAQDLRTLENFIAEYGMQPGKPTPIGQQQMGASAKAEKAERVAAKQQQQHFDTIADIVDTQIDLDDAEDAVEEGRDDKIEKIVKRKNKLRNKIKQVLRAQKYKTQGEPVFEINFNNADVIKTALDGNVNCGFEAEVTFPELASDGNEEDFLDGLEWIDIHEMVYDQEGMRTVESLEENYREWLQETEYFWQAEDSVIDELVSDRKTESGWIEEFAGEKGIEDEVDEYKTDTLAELEAAADEGGEHEANMLARYESYSDTQWTQEYIEENLDDEYVEWLRDGIRDNGEQWDDAWERAMDAADMNTWMSDEYGDWYSLLSAHDIFLVPDGGEGGVEAIGELLEEWASQNSITSRVDTGSYHAGAGNTKQDYWRVEEDSSIEGEGAKGEIISPVYDNPREMLKEMKSLFAFLEEKEAETNSSTGLHITMSIPDERKYTNPLKMALLLGDKYLLKQFGREFNSYAKSQQSALLDAAKRLESGDISSEGLSQVEQILKRGINYGKFSSINFKDIENDAGNRLVEFRIGGGDDYHAKFDIVAKSAIRYAATMLAAHDEAAYRKDYIKAISKLVNAAKGGINNAEMDNLEKSAGLNIKQTIFTNLLKTRINRNSYLDTMEMYKQATDGNVQQGYHIMNQLISMYSNGKFKDLTEADARLIRAMRIGMRDMGVDPQAYIDYLAKDLPEYYDGNIAKVKENLVAAAKALKALANVDVKIPDINIEIITLPQGKTLFIQRKIYHAIQNLEPYDISDIKIVDASDWSTVSRAVQLLDTDENREQLIQMFGNGDEEKAKKSAEELIQAWEKKYGFRPSLSGMDQNPESFVGVNAGILSTALTKNPHHPAHIVKESAFDRFDKLTLSEQLAIISRVDKKKLDEAWSKKYKDSINCSNPKGFSQKAHCAGKKKATESIKPYVSSADNEAHVLNSAGETVKVFTRKQHGKDYIKKASAYLDKHFASLKEGAVPVHNTRRDFETLMAKPLLGSDIQSQMEAYFVVPDPSMIRDFRAQIASAGKGVDLRPTFKAYAERQLHPSEQQAISESKLNEYDDLNAEKPNLIKTISGLDASNEKEAQLLDRIYKLLHSEHINTTIGTAFQRPLADEGMSDAEKQQIMKDMTAIIGGLDSDYGSVNKFVKQLETTGTAVNIAELAKPLNTFNNVFGSEVAINAMGALANYGVGKKQKGPGEYALAVLSDKIRLATGEGDLEIDGIGKVELKAALTTSGGRIGYGGGSQKAKRAVIDKYAEYIPTVVNSIGSTGGSLGLGKFIQALNADLPISDINNQKIRKAIAADLLAMDLEQFAGPVVDTIAKTEDATAIEDAYLRQNFAWYKDRDDFDALLLMHIPNRKTAMIRNADDLIKFRRSGHSNATSISIIPTQAGAGREQWAQLTLNKGKV